MRQDGNGPDRDHPSWISRNAEMNFITKTLDKLCLDRGLNSPPDDYGNYMPTGMDIIHGGARGADRGADEWGVANWVPVHEFKADWDKYGKLAGPIRNKEMLEIGKPDLVIAFPGGKGTSNMVQQAKEAGVEVIEVAYP